MGSNPAASAGNRTPIDCLEGNHANHYTTDASIGPSTSLADAQEMQEINGVLQQWRRLWGKQHVVHFCVCVLTLLVYVCSLVSSSSEFSQFEGSLGTIETVLAYVLIV